MSEERPKRIEIPSLEDLDEEELFEIPDLTNKRRKINDDVDNRPTPIPIMRASTNPFGRTIQEIASSVAERSKPRPTTPAPFPGQLSATVNVAGFVKASSFKQLGMPPPQSPVAAKQAFPPAPLPKSARSGPSKGPTTTLQVSERQRKNPVTDHIKAVKKEFSTHIIPDFIMTSNSCAFFLSIQYHKLHPEYIKTRIKETPSRYAVRVLLVYVDTDDNSTALNDLNKFAIFNNMTLILAWSTREAARYIESFNYFEHKSADAIKERIKDDPHAQAIDALTVIRPITAPVAANLLSSFGNMRDIFNATMEELALVPGLGERRVRRLYDTFNRPFAAATIRRRAPSATISMSPARGTQANTSAPPQPPTTNEEPGYSGRINDL